MLTLTLTPNRDHDMQIYTSAQTSNWCRGPFTQNLCVSQNRI